MHHRPITHWLLVALIPVIFLYPSCHQAATDNRPLTADTIPLATTVATPTKPTSIDAFRRFRDAVYQNDRNTVKSYFTFPVTDSSGNIWVLALGNYDEAMKKKTQPFTSHDFDKYYSNLFPKEFANCLLKIKSDTLFQTGEATAAPKLVQDGTTYTLYAGIDSNAHTLSLNLLSVTPPKEKDADKVEFSTIYIFNLKETGQMEFNRIELAG